MKTVSLYKVIFAGFLLLPFFVGELKAEETYANCKVSFTGTYTYFEGAECSGVSSSESDLDNTCTVVTKAVLCNNNSCSQKTELNLPGIPAQFFQGNRSEGTLVAARDTVYSDKNGNFTFTGMPCDPEVFGKDYISEFRFNDEDQSGYQSFFRRSSWETDSVDQNAYGRFFQKDESDSSGKKIVDRYGGVWFLWNDNAIREIPADLSNVKVYSLGKEISTSSDEMEKVAGATIEELFARNVLIESGDKSFQLTYSPTQKAFSIQGEQTFLRDGYPSKEHKLTFTVSENPYLSIRSCRADNKNFSKNKSVEFSFNDLFDSSGKMKAFDPADFDICFMHQTTEFTVSKKGSGELSSSDASRLLEIKINRGNSRLNEDYFRVRHISGGRFFLDYSDQVVFDTLYEYTIRAELDEDDVAPWSGYLRVSGSGEGIALWGASIDDKDFWTGDKQSPTYGKKDSIELAPFSGDDVNPEVVQVTMNVALPEGISLSKSAYNISVNGESVSDFSANLGGKKVNYTLEKKNYNSDVTFSLSTSLGDNEFYPYEIVVSKQSFQDASYMGLDLAVTLVPKTIPDLKLEFENLPSDISISSPELSGLISTSLCTEESDDSCLASASNPLLAYSNEEYSLSGINVPQYQLAEGEAEEEAFAGYNFLRLHWPAFELENGTGYAEGSFFVPLSGSLWRAWKNGIVHSVDEITLSPTNYPPLIVSLGSARSTGPLKPHFVMTCNGNTRDSNNTQPEIAVQQSASSTADNNVYELKPGTIDDFCPLDGELKLELGEESPYQSDESVRVTQRWESQPWQTAITVTKVDEDFNKVKFWIKLKDSEEETVYFKLSEIKITEWDGDYTVKEDPDFGGYLIIFNRESLSKDPSFTFTLPSTDLYQKVERSYRFENGKFVDE